MSSVRDNTVPPQRKEAVHYQRKVDAPQQSEIRQDTFQPKSETSRNQQATFAGKKKSVTFGDSCTEEEKQCRKHAPTAGKVITVA